MNFLHQTMIRLGLSRIDNLTVNDWLRSRNSAMLVFALSKGPVKVRRQILYNLRPIEYRDHRMVRTLIRVVR